MTICSEEEIVNGSGCRLTNFSILIKVEPPKERKTRSGLITTTINEQAPNVFAVDKGVIVDYSEDCFKDVPESCHAKKGDLIRFVKYAGHFISHYDSEDGNNYRIMQYTDIIYIFNEKQKERYLSEEYVE